MKPDPGEPTEQPGLELGSTHREARTCPVCGTKFYATADSGFCPVCILRGATGQESAATREPGSVSGAAGSFGEKEDTSEPRRFEHYEVILDEAGRPIELGRGAMGVRIRVASCTRKRAKDYHGWRDAGCERFDRNDRSISLF